jgi:hypothetical protein
VREAILGKRRVTRANVEAGQVWEPASPKRDATRPVSAEGEKNLKRGAIESVKQVPCRLMILIRSRPCWKALSFPMSR